MPKRRKARRKTRLGAPPLIIAEVPYRCSGGERTIKIVGPSANQAIQKAHKLVKSRAVPSELPSSCRPAGGFRIVRR